MTPTKYYVAKFAQAFGYYRKNQRMSEAASEMHLLREAEAYLGQSIWKNVETIEELSVEYWNLRKISKEMNLIQEKLNASQAKLDGVHLDRATILNSTPEIHQELLDERTELLANLEKLAFQRDEIISEAREVRRAYEGLKMKLEVVTKENEDEKANSTVEPIHKRLEELKLKFADLKTQRISIGKKIEEGNLLVTEVDQKLAVKKSDRRVQASEAYQHIGDGNKEISLLRAEAGVLETQMRQLYAEIGRYVSRNSTNRSTCFEAVASQRGLIEVMRALRQSIALNHRLAGMS